MVLSDVAEYQKDRIEASEIDASSYVSVENLLQNKEGKRESDHVPDAGRLTRYSKGDILIGNIRPYLRKIWLSDSDGGTNGDVLDITIFDKQVVTPEFLYYVLSSETFFNYDVQNSKGAKMPRGDKAEVMNYTFAIPLISRQNEIVNTLEHFDTLCTDISSGLPAEIDARQKQYEYYRDKLLNFKEKEASS